MQRDRPDEFEGFVGNPVPLAVQLSVDHLIATGHISLGDDTVGCDLRPYILVELALDLPISEQQGPQCSVLPGSRDEPYSLALLDVQNLLIPELEVALLKLNDVHDLPHSKALHESLKKLLKKITIPPPKARSAPPSNHFST